MSRIEAPLKYHVYINNWKYQVSVWGSQWVEVWLEQDAFGPSKTAGTCIPRSKKTLHMSTVHDWHIHVSFLPRSLFLLRFRNKPTGGCLITGTYTLYPAYCKSPTFPEDEHTMLVLFLRSVIYHKLCTRYHLVSWNCLILFKSMNKTMCVPFLLFFLAQSLWTVPTIWQSSWLCAHPLEM